MHETWRLVILLLLPLVTQVTQSKAQSLEPISFDAIAGWKSDNLEPALDAFRRSCHEIRTTGRAFGRPVRFGGKREHWLNACKAAGRARNARHYFEAAFLPFKVIDALDPDGLFTGYYEPEMHGSRKKSQRFSVPVYRKPDDLVGRTGQEAGTEGVSFGRMVDGRHQPYHTRKDIEHGAIAGRGLEILWLEDWSDLFFMQIQGSGRIRLENGSVVRLGFAAKSGRPYTSIGGLLANRGAIPREEMSMQRIRRWMAENPEEARQLMWENESFVFFRELELKDPDLGPLGAQHVQLTPERSIAVDRSEWMFGTPVWLDTALPRLAEWETGSFRRLLIAQDTGSAIRGMARGDVFWGWGDRAAAIAGHMKSPGSMVVLLPIELMADLGLAP